MASRIEWTHLETGALIDLWKQDHVQDQFNSMCRKKPIWEDMSTQLKIKGINRTGKQCEVRIHTLTTKYRKIVKANKESGASPKTCPFFEILDEVLGTKASANPPCLIDTGKANQEMVETSSVAGDNVTTVESDADETVNAVPAIPETSKQDSDVSISTSTREKATSSGSNKSRKRSQQDDLLASFMEMQEKSEERFLEFERKRMEMELKAEEKRQDREDEQERKQQAFLLELARIFSSNK